MRKREERQIVNRFKDIVCLKLKHSESEVKEFRRTLCVVAFFEAFLAPCNMGNSTVL